MLVAPAAVSHSAILTRPHALARLDPPKEGAWLLLLFPFGALPSPLGRLHPVSLKLCPGSAASHQPGRDRPPEGSIPGDLCDMTPIRKSKGPGNDAQKRWMSGRRLTTLPAFPPRRFCICRARRTEIDCALPIWCYCISERRSKSLGHQGKRALSYRLP